MYLGKLRADVKKEGKNLAAHVTFPRREDFFKEDVGNERRSPGDFFRDTGCCAEGWSKGTYRKYPYPGSSVAVV